MSYSLNAQFIDVNLYENKAQAYAILSAQFSKEAFLHAKSIRNSTHFGDINNFIDTGAVYTQLAIEFADSALLVASSKSIQAIIIMKRAKQFQLKSKNLYEEFSEKNQKSKHISDAKPLIFSLGNAIDDAYLASLLFEDGAIDTVVVEKVRDVTRLETDEKAFMLLKKIYEQHLLELDSNIVALDEKAKNSSADELALINEEIERLKNEKNSFREVINSTDDKLSSIRKQLSENMLQVVDASVFSTTKTDFYTDDVPIPFDSQIPEKLVYRVQVGYFYKKVNQNYFKGIFPLTSERDKNGYYVYSAGNFPTYYDAKNALSKIKENGFFDAFVVCYYNGNKITIPEALSKEGNR